MATRAVLAFVFVLAFSPLASADVVSFLDPLLNVDTALGTGDLGITTFTILGGQFQVSETSDYASAKFYRRSERGLGVTGGENDEIDLTNHDVITITALTSYNWLLTSFELRSLYGESEPGGPEKATVRVTKDGIVVNTYTLFGTGVLGVDNGVANKTFGVPVEFDKIEFYVASPGDTRHDYAVAKLGVDALAQTEFTPEPAMFAPAGLALAFLLAWRRRSAAVR